MRALALGALAIGACGGSQRAMPAPSREVRSPSKGDAATGAGERAAFDRLVAEVRRLHVFTSQTEKNRGRRWEDDLPGLALEFEHADTHEKLSVAVEHFVNSLHNPHCWFDPSLPSDPLSLGFSIGVEWKGDTPTFRVWEVDDDALRATIAEGDVVQSVDGVAAGTLVERHALVSRANNRRGVARDVGHWLTDRSTGRCRYRSWAELLRTLGIDAFACPICQGRMRILALVRDPDEVRRFLQALGKSLIGCSAVDDLGDGPHRVRRKLSLADRLDRTRSFTVAPPRRMRPQRERSLRFAFCS